MLMRSLNIMMVILCILATAGAFFVIGCDSDDSDDSSTSTIMGNGDPDPDPEPVVPDLVVPNPDPDPEPNPVDNILLIGSRVKVTDTVVDGVDKRLRIREAAGLAPEIIGSAGDGATGTIVDGPVLRDDHTWFEVDWDDNGKVGFNEGHDCCLGWSAETDANNVERYLTEIE